MRIIPAAEIAQTLNLSPAWRDGGYLEVKVAAYFSNNSGQGMPSDMATYLLMSGKTGRHWRCLMRQS